MKTKLTPNALAIIALLLSATLSAVAIAEELASKDPSGRSLRLTLYCVMPVAIAIFVRQGALNRSRVSPVQKLGIETLRKTKANGVVVASSANGPVVLGQVSSAAEYLKLLKRGQWPAGHTLVVTQKLQVEWQREIEAALKR